MDKFDLLSGMFSEKEKVTVKIYGKKYTRVVHWSGYYKDLIIVVHNMVYFPSDFVEVE